MILRYDCGIDAHLSGDDRPHDMPIYMLFPWVPSVGFEPTLDGF
jgi:hypothetical protein